MEMRVFIVLLACLSSLIPPALGTGLVAKAAAVGAAKGAIIGGIKGAAIGAGVGLAAKGAAALVAKKALLGLFLKAAVLKGAALLAVKKALVKGVGTLALKGLSGAMTANRIAETSSSGCQRAISGSPLLDILSSTARRVQCALRPSETAAQKTRAVYRIISRAPALL